MKDKTVRILSPERLDYAIKICERMGGHVKEAFVETVALELLLGRLVVEEEVHSLLRNQKDKSE